MSGFLRPEVAIWLSRWGETALMALLALGFAWQSFHRGSLLFAAFAALATALAWAASQKARLRLSTTEPGIVTIDEARIAYFAPIGGGVAELDAVMRVAIDREADGTPVWVFDAEQGARLRVPAAAEGAVHISEYLAALPGFQIGRAVRALEAGEQAVIWVRGT